MSEYQVSHFPIDGGWPIVRFKVKAATLDKAVVKAKRKAGVGRALTVQNHLGERHTEET